ncbi:head completion/stabilization protein [Pantoea phytobeneficialis]|uniref:Head completion/stabilization protein n=1 Tax=Pantoea phytobeneficialis TaxID=2052056 RepID=A0AAP9H7Q0_9GAMM|nr:head completion/stabilization protein [Pantoea phytobeneficialis]MDO6408675.1 head completion/stabilization protein [Pantoea phytobeneficialis]QGR08104.1 head completion/stabilization protein [Pantoea phytobeneficialis]
MTTLVIPAPRPAESAEPPVKNTFFWPDIDLKQLRDALRYEGTVTAERLRLAVKTAISEVNAELYDWRADQMAAGFKTLVDVPAETLDGISEKVTHYVAAVSSLTAATIAERYRGYDATGTKKAGEIEAAADEYWRDARFSISRIASRPGCIVDLL